jgi:hypothetical protein
LEDEGGVICALVTSLKGEAVTINIRRDSFGVYRKACMRAQEGTSSLHIKSIRLVNAPGRSLTSFLVILQLLHRPTAA